MSIVLNKNHVKDNFFLQIPNLFILFLFIFYSPIDIECDGTTQIAFAKSILASITNFENLFVSSYRAPLFAISTIFSGTYLFNSFIPLIIFNSLICLLMPSIIYYGFIFYNRKIALCSALTMMMSLIPFIQIKLILGTHLMVFFTVCSLSLLLIFLKKESKSIMIFTLISSFLMFFTRWEGIFLFIGINLIFLYYFFFKRDLNNYKILKKTYFKSILIFTLFIFLWLFIKAIFLNFQDAKMDKVDFLMSFKSMHNASGAQLLWKVQNSHSDVIMNDKFYLNIDKSLMQKERFITKDSQYGLEVYKILLNYFKSKDITYYEKYKTMIPLGGVLDRTGNEINLYEEHFGKFKGNPQKITDNIFDENFKSSHYVFIIPEILKKEIGIIKADALLKKWSQEIIFDNPIIFMNITEDLFSYYGVNFRPLLNKFIEDKNPQLPELYKNVTQNRINLKENQANFILGYWKDFAWYNIDFNLGNCASNTLSTKMFDEYHSSFKKNNKSFLSIKINKISSFTRNLVRNVFGPLILILFVILIFRNPNVSSITLFSSYFILLFALSYVAGSIYLKYDNYTLPILIFIFYKLICDFTENSKNYR